MLTTIEALQARGIGIVTRAQVYAECKDDTVDYEDVSIAFIYLKAGLLKAKGSIASTSRSGPRMVCQLRADAGDGGGIAVTCLVAGEVTYLATPDVRRNDGSSVWRKPHIEQ